jgi:hypothetical protein
MKSILIIAVCCTVFLLAKSDEQATDEESPNLKANGGNIHFDVIGNADHLFLDEDFEKIEAQLLHTNPNHSLVHEDKIAKALNASNTNKTKTQIVCNVKNNTDNKVQLVNGSQLSSTLTQSHSNDCFVVMFYASWCRFSGQLAPYYNALPRAFSQLDIFAIDLSKSLGYATSL